MAARSKMDREHESLFIFCYYDHFFVRRTQKLKPVPFGLAMQFDENNGYSVSGGVNLGLVSNLQKSSSDPTGPKKT
jgi:hypothetical protein